MGWRMAEVTHIHEDSSTTCWKYSLRTCPFTNRIAEMHALYRAPSISISWLLATSLVSGHMFISSPSPIGETKVKEPLSPNGDNFPCHGVSLPTTGGTKMHAGSTQSLEFDTGTVSIQRSMVAARARSVLLMSQIRCC